MKPPRCNQGNRDPASDVAHPAGSSASALQCINPNPLLAPIPNFRTPGCIIRLSLTERSGYYVGPLAFVCYEGPPSAGDIVNIRSLRYVSKRSKREHSATIDGGGPRKKNRAWAPPPPLGRGLLRDLAAFNSSGGATPLIRRARVRLVRSRQARPSPP